MSYAVSEDLLKREKPSLESNPVRIIVEVEGEYGLNLAKSMDVSVDSIDSSSIQAIETSQNQVMEDIEKMGLNAKVHESFTNVMNGFSLTVNEQDIQSIEKTRGVKAVYRVNEYQRPSMETSGSYVNLDKALSYRNGKYDGRGTVVAVIDSGVDYTHKDLKLDYPTQAKLTEARVDSRVINNKLGGKYFTQKVPYGYNFFDKNVEVIDLGKGASMHGMHVAGTVAANGDENGLNGIAPEAQILAMKVFSNNPNYGSTYGDIIIEAIDESIAMGADVINMSLGATAGTPNAKDPEQMAVQRALDAGVVCAISAGNSSFSGNGFNPSLEIVLPHTTDMGVTGSPSVTPDSITVASLENAKMKVTTLSYSNDGKDKSIAIQVGNKDLDPAKILKGQSLEYVFCGLGAKDDFSGIDVLDKVALIERGGFSFEEKINNATNNGAIGVIVFNKDSAGDAIMRMGGIDDCTIPSVFMGRTDGLLLKDNLGKVTFDGSNITVDNVNAGKMSSFSSWGTPITLDIKPEITAPGGQILSTLNNDEYGMMSGTSMASPHIAGASASIIQRVRDDFNMTGSKGQAMVKLLMMNTAVPKISEGPAHTRYTEFFIDDNKCFNSPRQQGAGVLNLYGALETPVTVVETSSGLGEVSLGEISKNSGKINFELKLKNYGSEDITYKLDQQLNTSALFQGVLWADSMPILKKEATGDSAVYNRLKLNVESDQFDPTKGTLTIPANATVKAAFSVNLNTEAPLSASSKKPLLEDFEVGTFVEGFVRFIDVNDKHADLSIPFLGYYGDWDQVQILDGMTYADDTRNKLFGEGMFRNQNHEPLGQITTAKGLQHLLSEVIIGSVTNESGKLSSSYGLYPEISLLRNAAEVRITILDASGKLVETIDHMTDGLRKNYYDKGASKKTRKLTSAYWNGLINGQEAPNGKYTYRIELKIDAKDANWQTYDYPIFVDSCTPEVKGLKTNVDGNGKMTSVEITAVSDTILTRDSKDPSKIINELKVASDLQKGIRTYGLMKASGDFAVLRTSSTNLIDLKDVTKNLDKDSDGTYTLMPFVIGSNGAKTVGTAFKITFKDVVEPPKKNALIDVDFVSPSVHKDISLEAGKILKGSFKADYSTVSGSSIVITEPYTGEMYWVDDYKESALTFDKSLNVGNKVQLTINNQFDVKGVNKTFLRAVYPITDAFKEKLASKDNISEKYKKEIQAYLEASGYKSVNIDLNGSLIAGISATPETASTSNTSGGAITIDVTSSPRITTSSLLDQFEEGKDYYEAKTLVIANNNKHIEPSGASAGDKMPPTVTIDTPKFWSELTESSSNVRTLDVQGKTVYIVDFAGTVSDASALKMLKLNGADIPHTFNERTGQWDFTGNIVIKDGKNDFKILTSDAAGNTIEFKQEFFADLIKPTFSIDTNTIKFKAQGGKYYAVLNGFISDTFPNLKLKAGKSLVVNESQSFHEYNALLNPGKVNLNGMHVPLDRGQKTLYLDLSDYGNHHVTYRVSIPQDLYNSNTTNASSNSSSSSSSSGGSSRSGSKGASGSSSNKTTKPENKNLKALTASAFTQSKLDKNRHISIKAIAPANKKEMKISLDQAALKAAKKAKAVLEVDTGIAKLELDTKNFSDAELKSASIKVSAIKGSTTTKVQRQPKSKVIEKLNPVGEIIDINLNISDSTSVTEVHELEKSVPIEIPLASTQGLDTDKLALYYNNLDSNVWEYVGGYYDANSKSFKATLDHFSQYCIMEREIQFTDTDAHWAKEVISKIASKDVVRGYADGSFKPDGTITYAEFLTLVVKALEFETTYEGDIWYDSYIFASRVNGLIDPTFEFDPNANITREEMADILGAYLDTVETIEVKYDPIKFIDQVEIDENKISHINTAVSFGLFSGRSNNTFDPSATATRAEVSQVIYNLIQVVQ